jgi:hypothetical protein
MCCVVYIMDVTIEFVKIKNINNRLVAVLSRIQIMCISFSHMLILSCLVSYICLYMFIVHVRIPPSSRCCLLCHHKHIHIYI